MPEIHPRRIKIGGKYWTLVSANIPGYDGLAENDPKTTKKHIWISRTVKGKDLLDTIIHEFLHCFDKKWSEDAVLQFGTELATVLWDLGYRSEALEDDD